MMLDSNFTRVRTIAFNILSLVSLSVHLSSMRLLVCFVALASFSRLRVAPIWWAGPARPEDFINCDFVVQIG
jgi:hypothetical protein